MSLSPEHRRRLEDWLLATFPNLGDLEGALAGWESHEHVYRHLPPREHTAPASWVRALVDHWNSQGLVTPWLFVQLAGLRREQQEEVLSLQEAFFPPVSPDPAGLPLGQKLRERWQAAAPPEIPHPPFRYGPPAEEGYFVGRQKELSLIAGKVAAGVPVVLVGDPRMGKTSLLKALEHYAAYPAVYPHFRRGQSHLLTSFVSLDAGGEQLSPTHFWKLAFEPLRELPALRVLLDRAEHRDYPSYELDTLVRVLRKEHIRLLLLLDEFDVVTRAPGMASSRFFGTFRHVISNHNGVITVVIASRLSQEDLSGFARPYCGGSDFFNTMNEERIGPFSNQEVATLLGRAAFSDRDIQFLCGLAGQHPALLNAAAEQLYHRPGCYEDVAKNSFDLATRTFGELWPRWSPVQRAAFLWAGFSRAAPAEAGLTAPTRSLINRGYVLESHRGMQLSHLALRAWFRRRVTEADRSSRQSWIRGLGLESLPGSLPESLEECYQEAKDISEDVYPFLKQQVQEILR